MGNTKAARLGRGAAGRAITLAGLLAVGLAGHGFADEAEPLRRAMPLDDFVLREEMIPMRDGTRLYTIVMIPKDRSGDLPILMFRTPYDSTFVMRGRQSTRLGVNLRSMYMGPDYIYVGQDVRGRFRSEGDYRMFQGPRGPMNPAPTDHTTDTWDTIEWLVNNVDGNNGRVGVWGTSYPGWLTLAALRDPHPALAAAVPFNPVGDLWKADDFFHWGAFRVLFAFGFSYAIETDHDKRLQYPYENIDAYEWLLKLGSVGKGLSPRLGEQHEMWRQIVDHPAYGPPWSASASDQWFDGSARLVPTLHVHGFWDQEDIYGSPAAYKTLEKYDRQNDRNYFVAGPWHHGQHFAQGDRLGPIDFDESTGVRFRENVLKPFLREHLHGDKGVEIAPVTVFETGTNRWRRFNAWPPPGKSVELHLQPGGGIAFRKPSARASSTEFVSDPAKPVPYEPRPNWPWYRDVPEAMEEWRTWQVQDQRFVDGRPDVATWISAPLNGAVTVRGPITAHLSAETTGTDADWVVKLIDVYPEETQDFVSSGYQLMISGEILRGRYRSGFDQPQPLEPDRILDYTIQMPHVDHSFRPGHRIMVQIQSTWFPLYDRNPQTYVENIMYAPDEAYKAQRHRIHHSKEHPTYLRFRTDSD